MTRDGSGSAWDPTDYDERHGFVHEYGADLLDLLDADAGERVLDLGCGTGHLTGRVAEAGADAVGVDRSREMVAAAREQYPGVAFVRADLRAVPFRGAADAALSNAALHWVPEPDHDEVLAGVRGALRPGGRFVAEMGGVGNVASVVAAVAAELEDRGAASPHPWYFPTVGEYATRLEAAGFEVRVATLFDRPTALGAGAAGLAGWLDTFAGAWLAPLAPAERAELVAAVEDRLRPTRFRDGTWVLDYRRLRFVAVRPRASEPVTARPDAPPDRSPPEE